MRLTPSWLRSSTDDSPEERPGDAETPSEVTIYYSPPSDLSETSGTAERAAEFIPESDTALVGVLDEMHTPTTVDEVTDQLVQPARPPIDTWATVHEKLHQDRLPELDTSGYIEFDTEQGVIDCQMSHASTESRLSAGFQWASLRKLFFMLILLGAVSSLAVSVLVFSTAIDPVSLVSGVL